MTQQPPGFYDDLDETLAEAWRRIGRGVADRRSPFHHPTVATCGLQGQPRLRTVILRGCDAAARRLRFHTDLRSSKIAELRRDPRVAVHFYDASAKIQIRIEGAASIHSDDTVADAAWAASRTFSRQCYGVTPGPGTAIAAGGDFSLPDSTEEETAAGRMNFCAVQVTAATLEWLYLAHEGHRRALFSWNGPTPEAGWLAP